MHLIRCPYCGEDAELDLDPRDVWADNEDSLVQDCDVCCRPWRVVVRMVNGELSVRVDRG